MVTVGDGYLPLGDGCGDGCAPAQTLERAQPYLCGDGGDGSKHSSMFVQREGSFGEGGEEGQENQIEGSDRHHRHHRDRGTGVTSASDDCAESLDASATEPKLGKDYVCQDGKCTWIGTDERLRALVKVLVSNGALEEKVWALYGRTMPGRVTAASNDSPQLTDISVTEELIADQEVHLYEARRSDDYARGHRFAAYYGKHPAGLAKKLDKAPEEIRDLANELLANEAKREMRQRYRERIRVISRAPKALRQVALGLHVWLEEEREIPFDDLSEAARDVLRIRGAHWRAFRCLVTHPGEGDVGCLKWFVSYHAPRKQLCKDCMADVRRMRDRGRKQNERTELPAPRLTTCPCGEPLDGQRSTRKYCSAACRQTAYRMRGGR